MSESNVLLRLEHLKKYFPVGPGYLHAVDDINLSIEAGKTLGVVGESGCGKTTLGRTILGLTPATGGKIIFDGQDITACPPKQQRQMKSEMQIIFQDPCSSLNPRVTISKSIEEPLLVSKLEKDKKKRRERAAELMALVGLSPEYRDAYPHELDNGRLQRVGIARALALNPRFMVCDEPVSALDVSVQAQILNLLLDIQEQRGLTYVFITHDLAVVHHLADHIAVMYLGQCVEYGTKEEVFTNPLHPYTKALLSAILIPGPEGRNRKIELLKGEITSAINPPVGCRFAPRCLYTMEKCTTSDVHQEVKDGSMVACNLYK